MELRFETEDGPLAVTLGALTVAGWTGRDRAKVAHHVAELAAIGVPAPSATPLFYRVSPALATQAPEIAVLGAETSGEAEPFLLRARGALWLGLASDHTDRGLEAVSVAHSKQVCAKPVAGRLWRFDGLAGRLDTLVLRCRISGPGAPSTLYQEGALAEILPLADLLAAAPLEEGAAMLCGTLLAIGGIRPAPRYEMELSQPDGSAIALAYAVRTLPVVA